MINALLAMFKYLFYIAAHVYITLIMLRFFMQYFRADFHNPLSQFIVKATTPALKPIRKIIPGWRGLDLSSIFLSFIIMFTYLTLDFLVNGFFDSAGFPTILASTVFHLLHQILMIFFFALLLQVILSWTSATAYSPISPILYAITEPILKPIRKRIPQFSGLDFSVFVASIIIVSLMIFISQLHFNLLHIHF